MLRHQQLSESQKQGVRDCIPKYARPHTPEDYRPITLLNTDYVILASLTAARVRPILAELLHPSQYCGVPGNTIFDAVTTVGMLVTQSPPFPRYLVPPRSKYSPQHLVLKHPQLPFLPQCTILLTKFKKKKHFLTVRKETK